MGWGVGNGSEYQGRKQLGKKRGARRDQEAGLGKGYRGVATG